MCFQLIPRSKRARVARTLPCATRVLVASLLGKIRRVVRGGHRVPVFFIIRPSVKQGLDAGLSERLEHIFERVQISQVAGATTPLRDVLEAVF